jgi:uncharacterized protein
LYFVAAQGDVGGGNKDAMLRAHDNQVPAQTSRSGPDATNAVAVREIRAWRAVTSLQRMVGALGLPGFAGAHGVYLLGCRRIHTMFMRFALDCIGVDSNNRVTSLRLNIRPWRVAWFSRGTKSVIELQEGDARRLGLAIGMHIQVNDLPLRRDVLPKICETERVARGTE